MNELSFLNEFTKEEIVQWVLENCWNTYPSKGDMLFIHWQMMVKKHREMEAENTCPLSDEDALERDKLAALFNSETDQEKRMQYLKKVAVYDGKIRKWMLRNKEIDAYRREIDKVYEELEKERGK